MATTETELVGHPDSPGAKWALRTRREQGLPDNIEDEDFLRLVMAVTADAKRRRMAG